MSESFLIKLINSAVYPQPPIRSEFSLPITATVQCVSLFLTSDILRDLKDKVTELTQKKYTEDMYILKLGLITPLEEPETTLADAGFKPTGTNAVFVDRTPQFKVTQTTCH